MAMYWKKVAMIFALCEVLGGCGQQLPIPGGEPSVPVSGETAQGTEETTPGAEDAAPGAEGETTPPPVEEKPEPALVAQVTETAAAAGTLTRRAYDLANGDTVELLSLEAQGPTTAGAAVYTTTIPSDSVLRLCKADGSGWQETTAAPGTYQTSLLMVDSGEAGSFMAYIPQGWEEKENDCRRYLGIGAVVVTTAENGGYTLTLTAPALSTGNTAECMLAQSSEALVDWDQKGVPSLWATYTNLGDGRWCYDGYYWIAYSNYIPTGPNVYFQMTAAYLCRSMLAMAPYNRLADDLAPCMMDVMAQRQNEYGYFPTSAGSEWLLGDYGIGAGFYDTRFNTDLMMMFLDAWERYQFPQFLETAQTYADFFTSYVQNHSRTTAGGGLFVDDYYHPDGNLPTHTSLNHQVAQNILVYRLGTTLNRPDLTALGDRMLLAVTDTEQSWIRPDSSLHYAIYSNGRFGGSDYPYLTYNDLYDMQAYLTETRGSRNESLDRLMASKKAWMDANGVTQYKK